MAEELIDVKALREAYSENQSQFARRLGIPPNTVNGWERNGPPKQGVAAVLLKRMWDETADARRKLAKGSKRVAA